MTGASTATRTGPQIADLKARLKTTWMTGDYDLFSRYMEKDVGCGAGQLALIAARAGARVTGCDIATNWIERARAEAEGLDVAFDEGDAEALPYPDNSFDAVVSLIGAMFAPRPERVAAELARVCRPGGMIAMANWTPDGFVGRMFKAISKYIAPSGMPAPVLWGDEPTVRDRFRNSAAGLRFARRDYRLEYPFPPHAVVDFFRTNYGPMTRAFASLDETGREALHGELAGLWSAHNKAPEGATSVHAEYLEVIAEKQGACHPISTTASVIWPR